MLRIYDKQSRFYGFAIIEVNLPECPDVDMYIDMGRKLICINKGAREGANVAQLNAYDL